MTLKTLLVKLGLDTKRFKSGVNRALSGLDSLVARAEKLNGVAKAGGMAVLAGSALQLAGALVPAAGVMLAMPAAFLAVKGSAAILKLGLMGLGDAMSAVADGDSKKLDAALKGLAPSARLFVKEIAQLKKQAFDPVQQAVQNRLFEGLVGPLRTAAASVLPTARSGLVSVAGALNGLGKEALKTAATPMFRGETSKAFSGLTGVINIMRGAVGPLITVVLKLVNAGTPLLQRMVGWAVAGAKAAAAFLSSEQGASKLAGVAQRAGDTLATLGRIVGNLGVGLGGIFAQATAGSGDLLGTIERLTARFAAWAQSAQGQQQLSTVFSTLAQTGQALGAALPVLLGPLGAIASLLTSLPAPAQEVVAKILAFTIVAGTLGAKLGPVVSGVRLLVTGIGKVGPAAKGLMTAGTWIGKLAVSAVTGTAQASAALGRFVLSSATAAASFTVAAAKMVAQMALTAGRVVAGWVLMGVQSLAQAARVAAAWVLAMGPIGWIIVAVVALVALIVANWDTIKNAIAAAWEWVKEKTVAVWNAITAWFSGFWAALKSTFQSHVDWVKNLISRVWAAIQQTNATIWNAIKSFFTGLWNGIKSIFTGAVDKVKSVISGAWTAVKTATKLAWDTVTGLLSTAWNKAKSAVSEGISGVIKLVKELPGKILSGLGNLAQLLLSAGKDLINGLINGVKAMASKVIESVKKVIGDAIQGAKNLLGIASPSRVFDTIGQLTMAGMVNGIKKGGVGVLKAAQDIAKKTAQVVKGVVLSGPYVAGPAAEGEIARLLGGAKFGLDVKALQPKVPEPPKQPKPRSDPNDVTYDRHPPPGGGAGYVGPSAYGAGQTPGGVNVTVNIDKNYESPKSTPRRNAEEMWGLIRARGI
ncbi:hypothetical protein ACGFIV_00980 [Sphaerisporangium sp. NPDC049003]|uniref:phage tail protein n=1 Tax=Sphaerisporangium sp. NPDC049003 TaxID=3364517 RepID=UPI003723C042